MPATTLTEIQKLEQEIQEKQQALAAMKRAQPREPVEDYELKTTDGPVRLSDLFGEQDDLILVHNMGRGCSYCTLWADGFNGVVEHLQDRAAFVVVSPDPPEVQQEFAASRDWKFPMASAADSRFTHDMGFVIEEGVMPGVSTFHRDAQGQISRVASAWFGPGDPFSGLWHLFDLLDGGVNDWSPRFHYR